MLEEIEKLSPDGAAKWLSSLDVDWNHFPLVVDRDAVMDVDPHVLAHGARSAGAVLHEGGRVDAYQIESGPSTFIDGDLVVDGVLQNEGLLIIKGNLCARAIATHHTYLVVLGDLKAHRLLGTDESYGTYIVGNAAVDAVVLLHNHHMGVAGNQQIGRLLHDEIDDADDIGAELERWGVHDPFRDEIGNDLPPLPDHAAARSRV